LTHKGTEEDKSYAKQTSSVVPHARDNGGQVAPSPPLATSARRKDLPATLRVAMRAWRQGSEEVIGQKRASDRPQNRLHLIAYLLLAIREAGCFAVFIEQVDLRVTGGIYIEAEAFFSLGIDNFEAMNGQMVSGVPRGHQPDECSSERERKKDAGNDQET